jgi:hypothetical protein
MKNASLTAVSLCLIGSALVHAQPPAKAAVWPPAHMDKLPKDYLDRCHSSLEAGTTRLAKLGGKSSNNESIGWIRYGMPSLILGQKTNEINKFFESDSFVWTTNPKFGFSLFSVSYMRMYGLMNPHTGTMKGYLTPKAIMNFEKGMWTAAKTNSKIVEGKRPVWDMEGSENHHISSKTSDLLAAQFLRKLPEFANQKYDDGSTLEEQYEARRAYWLNWFDERAKRGQFVEAGSPSYQSDSIAALFNLRDFAEDPVLRTKAEMYLDLTHANIAEETLLTTRGGPKSRVKVGHEYDGGFCERGYDLLFNAPGRSYEPLGTGAYSTSNYYPPPAIVSLAKDTTQRGTYSFTKRWPGPTADGKGKGNGDPDGELWRTLDPERSVLRCGFATPNYVLGSAGLNPAFLDDASMGFRWQGVIFASDTLARIGFESEPANAKDWHGFNPFFSVQDRNVLVTQAWGPSPPNPRSALPARLRVYFSCTLDAVQEDGGCIFAKDGGAFAAVKVAAGGYKWTTPWKHTDTLDKDNKAFITLDTPTAPVILIANQAADYNGDFDAFKAAVKAEPVRYADGVLRFATITFQGTAQPPQVDGKTVNLTPSRGYNSAFIRSDWNSGLIHIRKGNETLVLDFRDPKNPKKTVNAPITDAFPPGVGEEKPIVLGKNTR